MFLGPFLWREMITSVRSARVFRDRLIAALLVTGVVVACVVVWSYWGRDRTSVSAAARFSRVTFGLIFVVQVGFAIGGIVPLVARAITAERDRNSLDVLMTTRLSSAEIVLGTMGTGLCRYANGVVATMPIVLLLTFFGSVDGRLALLAIVGLASTAFSIAALSILVSAGARTGTRAMGVTTAYIGFWFYVPYFLLILKPMLWPGGPWWLIPCLRWLLGSSPIGLGLGIVGLVPQPGGLVAAVIWMICWQTAGGVVLIAWAIARLRPASRRLYDVEGRTSQLHRFRAAMLRPLPRGDCGDDPVLWNEIHVHRGSSWAGLIMKRLVGLAGIGFVALATSWFALPAFAELAERGYGAFPEAFTYPEPNPFPRVLAGKMLMSTPGTAAPGQARLEFNIALRHSSMLFGLFFIMATLAAAAVSIEREQKCDTWLDLITTPLTGSEILRAKMLGAVWKSRGVVLLLIGIWTVGLLAGAVHPLGFLAALVWLAVSGWLFAALGVSVQLLTLEPTGSDIPNAKPARGLAETILTLLSIVVSIALVWTLPFAYEDVHAAIHAGAFPQFSPTPLYTIVGARTVATVCLLATIAQAAGAFGLVRGMCREFDATVGRPGAASSPRF